MYILLLGQLGLLTMAVCSIDIVSQANKSGQRLAGFVIILMWLYAGFSAGVFGHVLSQGSPNPTDGVSGFRLIGGMLWLGSSIRYRYADARTLPENVQRIVNTILGAIMGCFLVGALVYSGVNASRYGDASKKEVAEIKQKLDRNSKIIYADTARTAQLVVKNDSLLMLLNDQRQANRTLVAQVTTLTGQIAVLTAELSGVTRQLRRVYASVQRQLRSPVVPVSSLPTTPMNFDALDPNRVKAVPPTGKPSKAGKK